VKNGDLSHDISYKMIDKNCAEVYNQKLQSALGRKYLFKIIKITNREESTPSQDSTLVSYSEIKESVIMQRVQYWLDTNHTPLQVIIKEL